MSGPSITHDLTPSEVALAKILAAYTAWDPTEADEHETPHTMAAVDAVGDAIEAFLEPDAEGVYVANAKGRALLDRARKAGVL